MLFSRPYDYYGDKDYQNLGLKIRHSIKQGVAMGILISTFNVQMYNRPKNFAHLFSTYGKFIGLSVVGLVLQSGIVYTLAKARGNKDEYTNYFPSGIGPAIAFSHIFNTPFGMFAMSLTFGGWAAYQKYLMKNFNTTDIYDTHYMFGDGLFGTKYSIEAPFTRYIFNREDPGRRESD